MTFENSTGSVQMENWKYSWQVTLLVNPPLHSYLGTFIRTLPTCLYLLPKVQYRYFCAFHRDTQQIYMWFNICFTMWHPGNKKISDRCLQKASLHILPLAFKHRQCRIGQFLTKKNNPVFLCTFIRKGSS